MRLIESERLYVRKLVRDDLENYFRLNGDEEIVRYIRPAKTRKETEVFLREVIGKYKQDRTDWRLALIEKDTDLFIGSFAIIPLDHTQELQLGYALLKDHWGKGYATEITKAGVEYAFNTLRLTSIAAVTQAENIASQNVLLKCGFAFEKEFIEDGKNLNLYRASRTSYI